VGARVLAWVSLSVLLVAVGVPFYWMVATSLKTSAQIQSLTPYYYPRPVTFGNYVELLRGTGFPRWIRNSTAVAVGASLVTGLVS